MISVATLFCIQTDKLIRRESFCILRRLTFMETMKTKTPRQVKNEFPKERITRDCVINVWHFF